MGEDESANPSGPVNARLVLSGGEEDTQAFELTRERRLIVLGRGTNADVVLGHPLVSRLHARIELTDDGLVVTDLGSRNGTFIGNRRLPAQEPTPMTPGTILRLGNYTISIEIDGLGASRWKPALGLGYHPPQLPEEEFEVLGLIGRGAVGSVWAAQQKFLDRLVAIKVLDSRLKRDSEDYTRFLREARMYCKVRSPYVVGLYDIRFVETRPMLLMEYVSGPSCAERLKDEGPLPVPEVLLIGEDIAKALAAIHAVGVVHRDVKPQNMLLSPEGMAKLGDFGIAKDVAEPITDTGLGLGTLAYVAPEQALEAKDVDVHTDTYSLGATLYHLLTSALPIPMPPNLGLNARLRRLQREPPQPLRERRQDLPEPVEKAIMRMLAKVSTERGPTGEALATVLRNLREAHYPSSGSWPDLTKSTRRLPRVSIPQSDATEF